MPLQIKEFRMHSTRNYTNYSWGEAFYNLDVNKKVLLFNGTVLNIIRNFIPHETVIFDDRDPP